MNNRIIGISSNGEEWAESGNFPGYLISSRGRVYSKISANILTEGIILDLIKSCNAEKAKTDRDVSNQIDLDEIKKAIHYPDCWDTMAYPRVVDAIKEIYQGCHDCENSTCTSN